MSSRQYRIRCDYISLAARAGPHWANNRNDRRSVTQNSPFDVAESRRRCLRYRKRILEISQKVPALHIAPAFSCIEIVDAVYFGLLRDEPASNHHDSFILSKGHGVMAQYAVLAERGILPQGLLESYGEPGGRLGGHAHHHVPGIDFSVGSLGHGLALACGVAIAERLAGMESRVYALISDGELQEGSTWEALMIAPSLGLSSLVVFADMNALQSVGPTRNTRPFLEPVGEKFSSHGWMVSEVNGHDAGAIVAAAGKDTSDRPRLVICRTVKGKGVPFMENEPIWHYRSPNREEFEFAMDAIGEVGS